VLENVIGAKVDRLMLSMRPRLRGGSHELAARVTEGYDGGVVNPKAPPAGTPLVSRSSKNVSHAPANTRWWIE